MNWRVAPREHAPSVVIRGVLLGPGLRISGCTNPAGSSHASAADQTAGALIGTGQDGAKQFLTSPHPGTRSATPRSTLQEQQGFALIIVLWTVGILALLVSVVVADASREARLTATLRAQAVARAAADAMLSQTTLEVLRNGASAPGRRRFGDVLISVSLVDCSGRLNPNLASASMIGAFLIELGVSPQAAENLAAAIVDWRTPGQTPSPHGAKAPQYRAAGMTYGPAGRPFENLDEVGSVLGMNPTLLAAMKPHMTLWSTTDADPGFADALVLGALRATGAPPVAAAGDEARVIAITAVGSLPDAPSVTRRAVVRFGYSPDGRGWRVLAWDDGEPEP